jgi:hypothetical protein
MQTLDGQLLLFGLEDAVEPAAVAGPYRELLTTNTRRKPTTRRYRVELRPEPEDDTRLDGPEIGHGFA